MAPAGDIRVPLGTCTSYSNVLKVTTDYIFFKELFLVYKWKGKMLPEQFILKCAAKTSKISQQTKLILFHKIITSMEFNFSHMGQEYPFLWLSEIFLLWVAVSS